MPDSSRSAMSPRVDHRLFTVLLTLALSAPALRAQSASPEIAERDALEAMLDELASDELLAEHLRRSLAAADAAERSGVARRLADVYVRLLRASDDPSRLADLERHARALADGMSEVEAAPLRIDLLRARYLRAQESAERHRLRLATGDERAAAEATLRDVASQLDTLGVRLHRRIEQLEREERRGRAEDEQLLRQALRESRRLRSLSFYYAGWANYYLAMLTGVPRQAEEATRQLGWLLGATGEVPSVDRVPSATFRFDHVARAALGVAMAQALLDEGPSAVRWLDAVQSAEQLPDNIDDQLFATRLVVLAAARRWADLVTHINLRRRDTDAPLSPSEARLLAVLALEPPRSPANPGLDEILETLAQVAMSDLVERGQIGHVIDLAERFGTLPLGDQGFIVRYVRALRAYEDARAAHRAAAPTPDAVEEPARDDAVTIAYQRAADLFQAASGAGDAAVFADQRERAALLRGLALFFAGNLAEAASALESASAGDAGEEALWFAIVALDRAVREGSPSLEPRLDRLATLYLERHPGGERAARLLLLRAERGLVDPADAVEVLLGVAPEEPVYLAARREASRLLYAAFRRASGPARERTGARFVEITEPLIERESALARAAADEQVNEAAQRALLRSRQILEVLLEPIAPDTARARRTIERLRTIAADAGVDIEPLEAELAYRRLQIALADANDDEAERAVETLRARSGPFADAADRLLFADAAERWRLAAGDPDIARRVVRFGLRLLNAGSDPDPSIMEIVAAAAARIHEADPEDTFLIIALRLDTDRMERGLGSETSLRRLARLAEASGDPDTALEAWRRLLAGLPSASEPWFQARAESLRLIARTDPDRARAVLTQHAALYPQLGPPPWGEQMRELASALGVQVAPTEVAP